MEHRAFAKPIFAEIDATIDEWRERLGPNAYLITDIVAARELPAGCDAKVYRVNNSAANYNRSWAPFRHLRDKGPTCGFTR